MSAPALTPRRTGLAALLVGVVVALLPGWFTPARWFGQYAVTGPAAIPTRFAGAGRPVVRV